MNKKRLIYIGILFIVTVIVSITYFSYAYLTRVDEQHGKVNIVAGTLDYRIESSDLTNKSITLSAGEAKEIEIKVKSLNEIDSKYQLYTDSVENVSVGYLDDGDNSTGTISASGEKIIKIIIRNNSDTSKTVTFGVQGGLESNTLTLDTGRVAIELGNPLCQVGSTYEFTYTGDIQEFTAKCEGTYKIEVWGASGGNANNVLGGKGGYSSGITSLVENDKLYIAVGGQGENGGRATYTGGYNGGGSKSLTHGDGNVYGASGGGATHIAKNSNRGELKNYSSNQSEVLIVAGGGGGAAGNYAVMGEIGGAGGGTSGISGGRYTEAAYYSVCSGGTQSGLGSCSMNMPSAYTHNDRGGFGIGGNSYSGGGGGWYGGAAAYASAAGGSSYIGGVSSGQTIAGNQAIPTYDGTSTMTGNTGNGYAKITYLGTGTITYDYLSSKPSGTTEEATYNYNSDKLNITTSAVNTANLGSRLIFGSPITSGGVIHIKGTMTVNSNTTTTKSKISIGLGSSVRGTDKGVIMLADDISVGSSKTFDKTVVIPDNTYVTIMIGRHDANITGGTLNSSIVIDEFYITNY